MNALLTIALVISTVAYIIIGGVIIHKLEWDYESATRTDISQRLDQTVIQFLYNNSCVDEAELLELLKTVYYASDHGVGISQNVTRSQWINEWDISHSIFFISTTLTTIGYGNLVPKTPAGRAFTVVYALFGIPLQLVTLAALGWWLSRAFDQCFLRPCRFSENEDRSTWSLGKHVVRMLISFAIFLVFFAFIPAVVFQRLEDWTFGEGVYYAMITLTTIGLGDYEAGWKSVHSYGDYEITGGFYKLSVAIWIFLGLASFACVIATLQDTYSSLVWRIGDKAAKLKEMAGISGDRRVIRNVSRSGRRVAPADSDRQSDNMDSDNCHNDRIQIT